MDLYSEIILDHYKHPRNKGPLPHATHKAKEVNTGCGDIIQFQLLIKNKKIVKATFTGTGCAISQASASMLTDKLRDKSLHNLQKISSEDIYKMLGIPISPGRVKCALLALSAAKKAAKL